MPKRHLTTMLQLAEPIRHRLSALVPALSVVLAMVMFLVTEIVASIGFHDATPIAQRVWLRYTLHLLFMVVLFGRPTRLSFIRTGRPALQLFRSLLMLVMPMCYLLAVLTARGTTVFGVFSCAPLMVVALAALAGERVPRYAALLVGIGCIGALTIYRPDVRAMGWGTWPALGMALSYSAYIVLTRVLDRTETMLANLFYSALGVFIMLTLAAPFYWTAIGLRDVVAGAGIATSGWIGLWLLEVGLRKDTAARLAPFLLTQALLDGVFRAIDRGGLPAPTVALGSAIVAAAILAAAVIVMRSTTEVSGLAEERAVSGGTK